MSNSNRYPVNLSESESNPDFKIDEDAGIIRGVKVLGRKSRNRTKAGGFRFYSDEAMREFAQMYESIQVNFDHPPKEEQGRERPIGNQFGILENVQVKIKGSDEDGVYADLPYLKSHPLTPATIERARRFPKSFGLSHNAFGHAVPKGKDEVIEAAGKVFSVDLVSRPGTVSSLFESHSEGTNSMGKTVKELLESNKTEKEAGRLIGLLENEMAGYAAAPVEAAPEAKPEEQISAAFEAMAIAVLRDTKLDKASKLGKLRELLGAEEKLLTKMGDKEKPAEGGGGSEEKKPEGGSESKESEDLRKQVAALLARDTMRSLLEEYGFDMASVPADKRKSLLEAAADEAKARKIVESFPAAWKRDARARKPSIPSILQESESAEGYDSLREKLKGKTASAR